MKTNKVFYIKYLDNQPFKVQTHLSGQQKMPIPLNDVGDLITACTTDPSRRLLGLPENYGPLTLHLPAGYDKTVLKEDYFYEGSTAFRPGLRLKSLARKEIGSQDINPLIIKSKQTGITY